MVVFPVFGRGLGSTDLHPHKPDLGEKKKKKKEIMLLVWK